MKTTSEMVAKFTGKNGRKPQTEARAYVLSALITTLREDIDNAAYMYEDIELEVDRRRAMKAAKTILRDLERKYDACR